MVYKYRGRAVRPAETAISPAQVALPPTDGKGIQAADNTKPKKRMKPKGQAIQLTGLHFQTQRLGVHSISQLHSEKRNSIFQSYLDSRLESDGSILATRESGHWRVSQRSARKTTSPSTKYISLK